MHGEWAFSGFQNNRCLVVIPIAEFDLLSRCICESLPKPPDGIPNLFGIMFHPTLRVWKALSEFLLRDADYSAILVKYGTGTLLSPGQELRCKTQVTLDYSSKR